MAKNYYDNLTVSNQFFQPLNAAMANSQHTRSCPKIDDALFMELGVKRVLSQSTSGRDFLQKVSGTAQCDFGVSTFFASLKSKRRHSLCDEINFEIGEKLYSIASDPFAQYEELNDFDLYAGDGHYHSCASHDEYKDGRKHPVGHFFLLDLRSRALFHMDTAENDGLRKREQDIHLLKRTSGKTLRRGAPKGRKVMYVWDKAGIDFRFWHRMKTGSGVYFLSLEKENMKLEICGKGQWDREDPRNEGVISDELMATSAGVMVRRVVYFDAATGKTFKFVTTEFNIPPGLISLLYKCRWHIEKVFDEAKNKLEETKAWATSRTAKKIQAQFICITHNMMLILERIMEQKYGVVNEKEIRRRKKRLDEVIRKVRLQGGGDPFVYCGVQRITVCSVKFVRWLRSQLEERLPWGAAMARLRHVYATF